MRKKAPDTSPANRQAVLEERRELKMARSSHGLSPAPVVELIASETAYREHCRRYAMV